jgi:O-antigen/teichoic acid export membrane protein
MLNVARIISTLGKFFLFIYIARVIGEESLGQFTFAIIFTSFFAIVISLGMDDLLVREVSRDNDSSAKYLGNIAAMRLLLSLIVFIAIVVTINIMDYPSDTKLAVYIFGGYIVFTAFSFMFRANFRAFEKMEWDALIEILEALITTGAGLILIFSGYGIIALALTFLIASVISTVASFVINARKFTSPRLEFDMGFWKTTLKKATPFSVFALFILYPRVDTILLSSLKGDAVVGYYNAAYQIVMAFSPVVMNFMIALVPLISRYFISARTMMGFAYEKSFKYLVLLAFPASVGGMVLAHRIIPLLYGSGYGDSVIALQILVWNCLLLAMSRPMFYILGAMNRQGTCAVITFSALILSIGLNYLAVPRWSYIGSGAITILNGCLVTFAAWYATSKFGFTLPFARLIWKPLVASSIMGAAVYVLDATVKVNLFALIFLGVGVYIIMLGVTKTFSKDDLALLKELFHKSSNNREKVETPRNTAANRLHESN